MAFNVTFYVFTKVKNSTARPSAGTGVATLSCDIAYDTGVTTPTIILNISGYLTNGIPPWNYAYINRFRHDTGDNDGRYYYITNIRVLDGLFYIDMKCDVLATFREHILNATLYINRTSSTALFKQNCPNVVENYFPATAAITQSHTNISFGFANNFSSGKVVIGIINSETQSSGGVSYYACTLASYRYLQQYLMSSGTDSFFATQIWNNETQAVTTTSENLLKSQFNPMQYIVSCNWFPFTEQLGGSEYGTADNPLHLGWWALTGLTTGGFYKLSSSAALWTGGFNNNAIPKHPRSDSSSSDFLGNGFNLAPYTSYEIYIPPFGLIQIAPEDVINDSAINIIIRVDLITGVGRLWLCHGGTGTYQNAFATYETQFSVPMAVSQISTNYTQPLSILGGVSKLAGTALEKISSFFAGYGAAAESVEGVQSSADMLTGVGNAAQMGSTKATQISTNGSIANFQTGGYLYAHFYSVGSVNTNVYGHAYGHTDQLSEHAGCYVVIDKPRFNCACYPGEYAEMIRFFQTGVYLN